MRLVFCILFLIGHFCFSQNETIILKSFVIQDTVLLKWLPKNSALFYEGLTKGYVVEKTTSSAGFENTNDITQIEILPYLKRANKYTNSQNQNILFTHNLLSELIKTKNQDALDFAYFTLMIGSGPNKEIAEMIGVYFEDIQLEDKQTYYRIKINDTQSLSNQEIVATTKLSANQKMSELTGLSKPKRKEAYLKWEAESLQESYAAYWIERSIDSIHFTKRNETPYFFLRSEFEQEKNYCDYVDTAVSEGSTYYYRVCGINYFGRKGQVSNVIKVYVPKSLTGIVKIDSIQVNELNRIVIGSYETSTKNEAVSKVILYRADSIQGPYSLLFEQPYQSDRFTFNTTVPITSGDRYYYKVALINADFDTVFSFPKYFFTLDQIPPQVPQNLKGIINDSGIVSLTWNLNSDKDIRGYKVYRANALNEEFVEITKVFCLAGVFYDTISLANLTSEIYYKVEAVDLNYNHSGKSQPVLLLKPDTIPPVPAVLKFYESTAKGVVLKWENSSSKDIQYHWLIRELGGVEDTLKGWFNEINSFIDSTGISGNQYSYFIVAMDDQKNTSKNKPIKINYETGKRSGVKSIKSTVDITQKKITLNWELPKGEIYSVQIYRSINEGKYSLYKTMRGTELTTFEDSDIKINNTYHYKIKVVFKDGTSSQLSIPIDVVY